MPETMPLALKVKIMEGSDKAGKFRMYGNGWSFEGKWLN